MFSPQCVYILFRKAKAIYEKEVQMRRCKFCQVKLKHVNAQMLVRVCTWRHRFLPCNHWQLHLLVCHGSSRSWSPSRQFSDFWLGLLTSAVDFQTQFYDQGWKVTMLLQQRNPRACIASQEKDTSLQTHPFTLAFTALLPRVSQHILTFVLNSPVPERLLHSTAKDTKAFGGWIGNSVLVSSSNSESCSLG